MENLQCLAPWSLIDSNIRDIIEDEKECCDLEDDEELMTYNYTSVADVDPQYLKNAFEHFCMAGDVTQIRELMEEFIDYNYTYNTELYEPVEYFLIFYFVKAMLQVIDIWLADLTTTHFAEFKYEALSCTMTSKGIVIGIKTMITEEA